LGIPIGGGRKRRRSYADYKPPSSRQPPRSDPFRVVFYLILIAGAAWVYLNPDTVRGLLATQAAEVVPIVGPTPTASADPTNHAAQAEEAYQAGNLDEAIEFYRQAAAASPNTVEYPFQVARLLLYRSALEYGQARDATLQEAVEAANKATLADPFAPHGYAILGKIKDWQGLPEQGLADIQRALEADENFALGHSYMAEALVDLDRWDQAQTTIQHALSLDPNNVDIRRDYAYVLESLGDYASAATQYEAALQIQPNLPYLGVSLGRAYRVLGRYNEALDRFFEAQTLLPGNALIPYEIGRTYETYIGDPNAAMENYQSAVDLDADFPSPWVRIGTLQYVQGFYSEATVSFERALALGVDNVDVRYQLGLAYANEGQCGEALPHLQQARTQAEDDERIIDLVNEGLELCSAPTPTPGRAGITPTP
jgi:tetratricopeptide (TPR) repeat protein